MFKLLLTTTAVMTLAVPAMASKARLAALQNAPQIYDTQSIFDNPARAFMMGDFADLEFGATSTARTGVNTPETYITNGTSSASLYSPDAEGGFVRSHGDSKIGFYLGRRSAFTTSVRSLTGFEGQDNPFEILYGFQAMDLKWGVSFNYAKSEPKTAAAQQSQETMGMRIGVMGTAWEASLTAGLGSKATGNAASPVGFTTASTTSDYKGTTGLKANVGAWMDTTYFYGTYYKEGADLTALTGAGAFTGVTAASIEQSQYEVGVVDTIKAEGMNFFYGVSYVGFKSEDTKNNPGVSALFAAEQTQLPFVIGVEADATSWLVLRASAKQNILVGDTKPNGGVTQTTRNNTTVALGTGIRFNKFMLDATLAAGSVPGSPGTAAINDTSLMGNASLTYMF
jgi:hypothetical protein